MVMKPSFKSFSILLSLTHLNLSKQEARSTKGALPEGILSEKTWRRPDAFTTAHSPVHPARFVWDNDHAEPKHGVRSRFFFRKHRPGREYDSPPLSPQATSLVFSKEVYNGE